MARAVKRARARAGAVVASLFLVVACSGPVAAPDPAPGPYTIEVAGFDATYRGTLDLRTVRSSRAEITFSDYAYSPTVVQAIRGTRVRLTLTNPTSTAHTFTIESITDERLEPGTSTEIVVIAPTEAGLTFFCRYHVTNGMRGALNDPVPVERASV